MRQNRQDVAAFRDRLARGDQLLGAFVKFPTTQPTEILGAAGFDFVIVDQEHSALDRATVDLLVLAARAVGITALVRVPDATPTHILSALDCGATGVLVPHVDSVDRAREIAAQCRYRDGSRGYAATTRAGRFGGTTLGEHIEAQDSSVTCIAMIEDAHALEEIDDIARVEGIDAFFIGRSDLTVSLGASSPGDAEISRAVARIMEAANAARLPVIMLSATVGDARAMMELGANAFVVSTDQTLMKRAAEQTLAEFDTLLTRRKAAS